MSSDAIVEITYFRESPETAPHSGSFVTNHHGESAVTFDLSRWGHSQWSSSTCTFDSYGPLETDDESLYDLLVAIKEIRPEAWARIGSGGDPEGSAKITERFFPE